MQTPIQTSYCLRHCFCPTIIDGEDSSIESKRLLYNCSSYCLCQLNRNVWSLLSYKEKCLLFYHEMNVEMLEYSEIFIFNNLDWSQLNFKFLCRLDYKKTLQEMKLSSYSEECEYLEIFHLHKVSMFWFHCLVLWT